MRERRESAMRARVVRRRVRAMRRPLMRRSRGVYIHPHQVLDDLIKFIIKRNYYSK